MHSEKYRWVLSIVLAYVIMAPIGVSGQGANAASSMLELPDAAGDVQIEQNGNIGAWLDLTKVKISSSVTEMVAEFSFVDRSFDHPDATSGGEAWVRFEYREDQFILGIFVGSEQINEPGTNTPLKGHVGYLYASRGNSWQLVTELIATQNGNLLTTNLPLNAVENSQEFSPIAGEKIIFLEAASEWDSTFGPYHTSSGLPTATLLDMVPIPIESVLTLPGIASGIQISTPSPIKYSNGEATTFHWPIEVTNLESAPASVKLVWAVPSELESRYPQVIAIPGNQKIVADFFVTVPFNHQHGTTLNLPLSASSSSGLTSLQLGVLYPTVPQPAGHHNELRIHGGTIDGGARSVGGLWMNTLAADALANATMLVPESGLCSVNGSSSQALIWTATLSPRLLLGVDADIGTPAKLKATFDFGPLTESVLTAQFGLYPVSSSPPSDYNFDELQGTKWTLAASATSRSVEYVFEIPLAENLDYYRPSSQNNLFVAIVLCGTAPEFDPTLAAGAVANILGSQSDSAMYHLNPGAILELPLSEFHDEITLSSSRAVTLTVSEPVRVISPGGTALWMLQASNPSNPGVYRAEILGPNSQDAVLHSPLKVELGAESTQIPVSLRVPEISSSVSIPEIVVLLTRLDDVTETVAIRLQIVVQAGGGDDSLEVAKLGLASKRSPLDFASGFGVGLVAIALLGQRKRI